MTKTILSALALAAAVTLALPVQAAVAPIFAGTSISADDLSGVTIEKRRKRVPGGSGCDTPQDIAEHPECQL